MQAVHSSDFHFSLPLAPLLAVASIFSSSISSSSNRYDGPIGKTIPFAIKLSEVLGSTLGCSGTFVSVLFCKGRILCSRRGFSQTSCKCWHGFFVVGFEARNFWFLSTYDDLCVFMVCSVDGEDVNAAYRMVITVEQTRCTGVQQFNCIVQLSVREASIYRSKTSKV